MNIQSIRANDFSITDAMAKIQEYRKSLQGIRMDLDDLLYKLEHKAVREKVKAVHQV